MIERLLGNFEKFGRLTKSHKEAIIESTIIKEYDKGDFLLREGQRSINSYFVLQGCVRQYNLLDGEEKTTRFFFEDDWLISLVEPEPNKGSTQNWVCLEKCALVVGSEESAQALFKDFPELELLSRKIVEASYSELQQSVLFYHSDTAEQRYLKLLQKQPDIFQRIPLYHIASYIGVKPESLSRIRKRVSLKN